jgi:DNA repair protein RadD
VLNFTPPKAIVLRDYQAAAVEALREGIRAGKKRQLLVAGTGAGKTLTSAHILAEAAAKGSYTLFIVDRVALVDQASAVFEQYGIPHGVVQGNHPRWAPRENVQVCSAQTLARRDLPRHPALIIVDECHAQYRATLDFMNRNPAAVCIGLTATPFTPGMGKHWSGVVNVIPTRKLIEGGYLTEPKIYVARSPQDADLGLNSYGEFSDASATSAGIQIIGDVVTEWVTKTREHFGGPAKTIVFSPTVEHGRELCAAFAAAGYNFQQISYLDRSDEERAEKIAEFRRPDSIIHGLVSCGVLTKGFDVPDVAVGISCKPYRKSLSSHMQEIGRVMRTHPSTPKKLWLCHSGNVERFALDMFDVWENGAGRVEPSREAGQQAPRAERDRAREGRLPGVQRGLARPDMHRLRLGEARPVERRTTSKARCTSSASAQAMEARPGLRAECLSNPEGVLRGGACLCARITGGTRTKARKRAYAIWRGIYPTSKPGSSAGSTCPGPDAVRRERLCAGGSGSEAVSQAAEGGMTLTDAMHNACKQVGIVPPRAATPGRWTKCPVDGKAASNRSGRVMIWDDQRGGTAWNWATGQQVTFRVDGASTAPVLRRDPAKERRQEEERREIGRACERHRQGRDPGAASLPRRQGLSLRAGPRDRGRAPAAAVGRSGRPHRSRHAGGRRPASDRAGPDRRQRHDGAVHHARGREEEHPRRRDGRGVSQDRHWARDVGLRGHRHRAQRPGRPAASGALRDGAVGVQRVQRGEGREGDPAGDHRGRQRQADRASGRPRDGRVLRPAKRLRMDHAAALGDWNDTACARTACGLWRCC